MKLLVEALPRDGRNISLSDKVDWAVAAAQKALEGPVTSVTGDLRVERRGTGVHVSGQVSASTLRACERCSDEVVVSLVLEPDLEYLPLESVADDADVELTLARAQLDVGWFEQGQIDLCDVLCEVIALGIPPRIECTDGSACDARTGALLAERGKSGENSGSTFSALKNLH